MKIKFVLLLCCTVQVYANPSFSQQAKLDVNYENSTIISVLEDLRARTGYLFVYREGVISPGQRVSVQLNDASMETILDAVLVKNGFEYSIQGQSVAISRALVGQQPAQATPPTTVSGTIVCGMAGQPLAGVTVAVKNSGRGTITGADGRYTITAWQGDVLVYSYLGRKSVEIPYTGQRVIDVRMEDSVEEIQQVVVTGMFDRRAESFTGSSSVFTREELLTVGNQNVLRSLSNLDPSFMIMESLEFGSDPNRMPEIMLRGQSSFADLQGEYSGNPNQPLFILDGFEASLQMIFDLDMNRVESITILKDAAAKAIYGSKAGNGVVVITTIRPTPGRLRVSYSGSLDIEAPDLTGYNLMNAAEKLEFERSRGVYIGTGNSGTPIVQQALDREYNALLRNVLNGVDTYWLSQPLQTGIGHKHSFNLEGGDERMLYGIGLGYNNTVGVMKGSDRNTFSGNVNLAYTYKNLVFRNSLGVVHNNANNSPYGTFDEYTRLNPYWAPYDDDGNLIMTYRGWHGNTRHNPLYNATLNGKNSSSYKELRNNFQAEWKVLSTLRLIGRFNYTNHTNESDLFYPASHSMFINYDERDSNRKGRYTKGYGASTSYQADFGVNYSKSFGKHMFFANARWNISSQESESYRFTAEGFGNDNADNISFGAQWLTGSRPSGSSNNRREVGVVGALNYSFDDRYLFDVSTRSSASSMFGANNKWGLFWSLGLGWNIHKEAFAKDVEWLDRFKIRGSVGYTGSQNFDPYMARARYEYSEHTYDGRYGPFILGLPNDNLKWQRVFDYNIGTDFVLLNGMITATFDYFTGITDDMLINVAIPPSTGFSTFMENLGKIENRGFETNLALRLWRDSNKRGWFTVSVSGMHNRNRIKEISDTFEHRNNTQNADKTATAPATYIINDELRKQYTRPSTLYYEGQSMTAIWGVRSAGVNPITGDEVFYDLDGNLVRAWSALNQVVIGNTAPTLRGNINLSAGYKGFTFAVSASYKFGGDRYNTTLVDKVENVYAEHNLDRRILQSWNNPGEAASFTRLYISQMAFTGGQPTRPTSRFIMKDNELYISSVNAGYDFRNLRALTKVGIERLRVQFYMNELFRFSSIEIERGTSYPFARNFSFSLQATF
ncbi:MAG: SusC/RagA family TonB-linked outer membrane protein [Rikenellaceae bacterium]|nr:SusC/RagA family TonB-linked outer membrane protein [Rikenellaceae bacterium]MCL2692755.1 SusC/RagA family TonB-linked outer membrane protein [Rikenellaceae bacterium]